jgi:hypothetical protein
MSWLTDFANSLKGVSTDTQSSINDIAPAFSNTGGALTEAYKASAPAEYRNIFFDPSRDTPQNAIYRNATFADQLAAGKNPFAGEGETEYNQNMAKRAAIVASIFGGAALAGGAGAGSAAAPAAAAAPEAAAYGVGAGNTAGLGVLGGESAAAGGAYGAGATGVSGGLGLGGVGGVGTGVGASGAATSSVAPAYAGTAMGSSAMALPLGSQAVSTAPATVAPAAGGGSWAPYAQAGGTIMSTLFSGLMQMEQQKEQLKREKQMALAKSHLEKAQAENQALDTLIRVWQGARR